MKKILPLSERSESKGFTLIELLVVVSIIAILSVVGLALFSGIQNKARNDARKADIDAIAKALEVNHTAAGYVPLATGQFASGAIPTKDPQGFVYCGNKDSTIPTGDLLEPSTATACTPATFSPISTTIPPAGTAWKICAWLEKEGATAAQSFCKSSAQ